MTWTDPTGRHRTTHPADHHHHTHLPDTTTSTSTRTGTAPTPPPAGVPSLAVPDGPHSPLDFTLEHHLGGRWTTPHCRTDLHDLSARNLHPRARDVHLDPRHPHHRRRSRARPSATDPPPF